LVVLDVMLPSLNGFDLLQQLREAGDTIPVIILSAKVDLPDRLHGFDVGADDYLPKPFFVEELVARIKVVLTRHSAVKDPLIRSPNLTLDLSTHRAQWYEASAILSQREFSLLAFLMRSPGHIYSRKQILSMCGTSTSIPKPMWWMCACAASKANWVAKTPTSASPIESVRGRGLPVAHAR
jgi:DNA-binding response OmpR family regulator